MTKTGATDCVAGQGDGDNHDGDTGTGQDEHRHDCQWSLTPLCGEAEFSEEVAQMVAEEAPRLFAVVQEYGERADGRIAAWGMAFQDHIKVVKVDGATTSPLSPELAARCFSHRPHITARVVWVAG